MWNWTRFAIPADAAFARAILLPQSVPVLEQVVREAGGDEQCGLLTAMASDGVIYLQDHISTNSGLPYDNRHAKERFRNRHRNQVGRGMQAYLLEERRTALPQDLRATLMQALRFAAHRHPGFGVVAYHTHPHLGENDLLSLMDSQNGRALLAEYGRNVHRGDYFFLGEPSAAEALSYDLSTTLSADDLCVYEKQTALLISAEPVRSRELLEHFHLYSVPRHSKGSDPFATPRMPIERRDHVPALVHQAFCDFYETYQRAAKRWVAALDHALDGLDWFQVAALESVAARRYEEQKKGSVHDNLIGLASRLRRGEPCL
jgi:hypothetical protein